MVVTSEQHAHMQVMQRPFTAQVPQNPCIYAGEQGTINRFLTDFTGGTGAGQTAYLLFFHPNTGYGGGIAAANSAAAISTTPGANASLTPGFTTLASVAQKQRAVAAGIRFSTTALSLTTIVGEFAVGVVSLDTITTATTIDQLFVMAQGRANLTRDLHEARWYPNSFDAKYSSVNYGGISLTGSDTNDTNAVFVAIRGIPASTNISFQITNVAEWTPKVSSGMSVTATSSPGTDHQSTVQLLHQHTPGWHHTAKATAERLLEDTVKVVGKQAEKGLRLAAGKIFESGMAAFGL